jgi:type II secretory pathway component PulF
MAPLSLDRILALNDELAALAAAGVPVDLGQAAPTRSVDEVLEGAGSSIALRQGRGVPLEQAVAENPDLPPGYRSALAASLKGSRLTTALEACCQPAAALAEVRHVVSRALMGPLVVVTIS